MTMDDSRPQDVHFAWEDVMKYKNIQTPKHGKRPTRHLSISEYQDDPYDSDVDASQWSETESSFSTGRSSVAGSHSTRTSISLSGPDDYFGDEEQLDFPSYDDAGHLKRVSDLCDDLSLLPPSNLPEQSESGSPEENEHAEDDVAISPMPERHVDYLSHDWLEEDIWSSWKHLRSKRKIYSKKERLENAAWRIWEKERQGLATVTPESINWMKDRDVTWLYGPFQTVAKELDLCYSSGTHVSNVDKIRPILKKRTLSEMLLQRSLSASSMVKEAPSTTSTALKSQDLSQDVEVRPLLISRDFKKTVRFASTGALSDQDFSTPAKNVRFHHEVEQFIAVGDEHLNESENENENENENELEDCLTMYYSKTEPAKVKLYNRTPSLPSSCNQKPSEDHETPVKIVSPLPATTLKDAKDDKVVRGTTPQSIRAANKVAWSPCSYFYDATKGTVQSLEPNAIRAVYDGDDEEEDYIEAFKSPHHHRTSEVTSIDELAEMPRDVEFDEHVKNADTRTRFIEKPWEDETIQNPENYTDRLEDELAPRKIPEPEAVSERGSTETDSDVESDTFEDGSRGSDDISSGSSEYDYLDDLEAERHSHEHDVDLILDPVRQELVDRVMEEFWTLYDQGWDANITKCNDTAPNSSSTASSSTPSSTASSKQVQRKRQRIDGDDEPEDSEDKRSRQPRRLPASNGGDGSRFACPFRKHNPRQYNIYNNRVCALSNWQSIARVKEHLYRCHQISPHCKRCWRTFKTQQQLDTHITVAATDICEVQPGNPPAGITPAMERQLRSRKKSHPNQTDEERWKDIYKLLFPNEEVPPPYFEPVQTDPPSSPDSRDLADYEDYIRRELPRLVRSNIEEVVRRETQPLEAALIGSLVGIIQDCQDRVFRAYRETQGVDPEAVAQAISPQSDTGYFSMPRVTWAEDWTENRLPFQSNFLDAAFEAPLRSEQPAPDLSRLGQSERSRRGEFSDSGYASEPRCSSCQGSCTCVNACLDPRLPNGASIPARNSNGSLNESTPYPSWHQVDDDEADWWMNI